MVESPTLPYWVSNAFPLFFGYQPTHPPTHFSLQDQVVAHTIAESKEGRTPNPDIMCNSLVKFGVFYDVMGKHFNKVVRDPPTHPSTCPFIHLSIHPFTHSFTHPSIHSSIHPPTHLFIHSFIHSFIHPFTHPFTHSFTSGNRPLRPCSSPSFRPRSSPSHAFTRQNQPPTHPPTHLPTRYRQQATTPVLSPLPQGKAQCVSCGRPTE